MPCGIKAHSSNIVITLMISTYGIRTHLAHAKIILEKWVFKIKSCGLKVSVSKYVNCEDAVQSGNQARLGCQTD